MNCSVQQVRLRVSFRNLAPPAPHQLSCSVAQAKLTRFVLLVSAASTTLLITVAQRSHILTPGIVP